MKATDKFMITTFFLIAFFFIAGGVYLGITKARRHMNFAQTYSLVRSIADFSAINARLPMDLEEYSVWRISNRKSEGKGKSKELCAAEYAEFLKEKIELLEEGTALNDLPRNKDVIKFLDPDIKPYQEELNSYFFDRLPRPLSEKKSSIPASKPSDVSRQSLQATTEDKAEE